MSDRYLSFPLVFHPLIRTFDFVEGRLHLGKAKKNKFSFGFSLDLHYLCTRNSVERYFLDNETCRIACFVVCLYVWFAPRTTPHEHRPAWRFEHLDRW